MLSKEQLRAFGWPEDLITAAVTVAEQIREAAPRAEGMGERGQDRSDVTVGRVVVAPAPTSQSRILLEVPSQPPGGRRFL